MLCDGSISGNDEVPAIPVNKWISATVAEFESHLPNAVMPSSKPQPQGTFRLAAQWLYSHSPIKHSGSLLESSEVIILFIEPLETSPRFFF
jgi:hypothetical protein